MPWTEEQRDERELMTWFRSLRGEQQALVSIYPRERGYTMVAPRRRVPAGRNVYCSVCPHGRVEPVWFTNEPGDKARRRAQVAAARHLRGHLAENLDATGSHVNAPGPEVPVGPPVPPADF